MASRSGSQMYFNFKQSQPVASVHSTLQRVCPPEWMRSAHPALLHILTEGVRIPQRRLSISLSTIP